MKVPVANKEVDEKEGTESLENKGQEGDESENEEMCDNGYDDLLQNGNQGTECSYALRLIIVLSSSIWRRIEL